MRKPIVAVTADTLLADMKPINQKMADYAPRPLLNALGRVGLLPIILAYDDYADPEEYVDSFDALVLSGGPNPAPRFYGEEPLWCIGPTYEHTQITNNMYYTKKDAPFEASLCLDHIQISHDLP